MSGVAAVSLAAAGPPDQAADLRASRITWEDAASIQHLLHTHGISAESFGRRIDQLDRTNDRRVREGDLDHLIFYLLQSMRFTTLPAIEPALSAKAFIENGRVPDDVRGRTVAFLRAFDAPAHDRRLMYFRELVSAAFPKRKARQAELLREYARVMRFVHEKEFVAQKSPQPADAVAELYRTRGLSTDTAVEAGYLVYQGLGVIRSLETERRIRRILIVGPGLDLAPRTGLVESGPPESYQPWAVLDAVLSVGLSHATDLEVIGADINPRVVEHLRRSRSDPPLLTLTTGIQENGTVRFSDDYRRYFDSLGSVIGMADESGGRPAANQASLYKRVRVRGDMSRLLRAVQLDIVTERLAGPPFDLVIATNILPYFGDVELMLAMTNVAAMLGAGGVFLHNEPRPSLGDITTAVGLPYEQSRQAVIATVRGARAPLVDTVFLHRRRENVNRRNGEGEN